MSEFFGKYRGKVENNIDPMQMGRIQVSAPAVLGEGTLSWAMPSVPYAGPGVGFFAIPPTGANIWVEFEGGDPDYPIWSGCFWGTAEVPVMPAIAEMKVFKTESITLTISDLPGAGGFTLEVEPPAVTVPLKMAFDSSGITINCDPAVVTITPTSIEMETAPTSVKLVPDSLELTSTPSTVKLEADGIELSNAPATVKLAPDKIELSNSPATFKLSSSGIELENAPAAVKLSSSGIELDNSPAAVKLSSSGIELSNGAASVKLSSASVSINDGALEVI